MLRVGAAVLLPVLVAMTGACGRPGLSEGASGEVAQLMKARVNPAATAIAFELHHNVADTEQERGRRIAEWARQLGEAAAALEHLKPALQKDETGEYRRQADAMRRYAAGLRESAAAGDLERAGVWYGRVQASCTSCHRVYRFGEEWPAGDRR